MMTREQARQARELLGLTRYRLSQRCGIPEYAIHQFELTNKMTCGTRSSITGEQRQAGLQAFLEAAGVEFIGQNGGGPGVKLWKGERACGQ